MAPKGELCADCDEWKALRPSLLAQSASTTASLDRQLLQLHDSDLHLLTTDQMALLQAETAGDERGIGLVDFALTVDPNTGSPQVVTPLLGSPAFRAGLEPRDIIVSINGKSTMGLIHEDVMALLRGEAGAVRLTVQRKEVTGAPASEVADAAADVAGYSALQTAPLPRWDFPAATNGGVAATSGLKSLQLSHYDPRRDFSEIDR